MEDNNTPQGQGYSKDDGFNQEGKATVKTLNAITKATTKANKELAAYADTYKELNAQLKELQKSGGIPKTSGTGLKLPTSPSGGSKSTSTKQMNDMFKNVFGTKGKTALEALTKLSPKAFTGLTTELTALTTVGAKAVPVIGAVVAVLATMNAVGQKAYEQNMQLNRSLMSMGARSSELTKSTSDAANSAIKAKNSWAIAGNNLSQAFEPVYTGFQELLGWLGTAVADVTKGANDKGSFTQGNSMARWYTSQMETNNKVPESSSLPVISQTATQFGASGMDPQSAANAAITTYDTAYKIALKYGAQSQDVAKDLSDAWLNGSDSATKYGIVVNDNILAGYMASKGVDIVNVKITDAAKQAYQYQLVMDEAAAGDSSAMRAQIAQWNKLGQTIADASQQLFSYDKVINIQGRDYKTPTIALGDVDTGSPSGGAGVPPTSPIGGGTPVSQPVIKPIVDTQPIKQLESELAKIPNPYTISVPVGVPGFETIPALERELGRVPQRYPVSIPVTMPGYEFIPNALQNLFQIPHTYPVSIPISVPGLELLREAVNLQHQLSSSPAWSTGYASQSMPSTAFAPMAVQRGMAQSPVTSPANVLSGNRVSSSMGASHSSVTSPVSSPAEKAQSQHYTASPSNLKNFAGLLGVTASQLNTASGFAGTNGFNTLIHAYLKNDSTTLNKYLGYAGVAKNVSIGVGAVGTAATFGIAGVSALGSALAASLAAPAAQKVGGWVPDAVSKSGASSFNPMGWLEKLVGGVPAKATGGIGVKETLVRAFEGNKAEAIIPLETAHGQNMLSSAMGLALKSNQGGGATREVTVHVNVPGLLLTNNPAAVRQLGGIIREEIARQDNKDGGLNYGSGK